MFRKVVNSTERRVYNSVYGAFNIEDELECGHSIIVKGSRGHADKRKCLECVRCSQNNYWTKTGDMIEVWDAEKQWPIRITVGELYSELYEQARFAHQHIKNIIYDDRHRDDELDRMVDEINDKLYELEKYLVKKQGE